MKMGKISNACWGWAYTVSAVMTGMIGMTVYNDPSRAFVCALLAPLTWVYWLISHTITLSIIKKSFEFFFQ